MRSDNYEDPFDFSATMTETSPSLGTGDQLHRFIKQLYPICRSITGAGLRETLQLIADRLPDLRIESVPSGTPAFDWNVPNEWNIKRAYVKDASSRKVIDFDNHNLHVVNYSVPVDQKMSLAELRSHLHSIPEHPDWIPYRTSYYNESWGFCLAHRELEQLAEGTYDVLIDSTLKPGVLNYGEWFKPGRVEDEVLITCHACHPSLCNDNLSGIAVAVFLAQLLSGIDTRLSYRFLFIPGGIGSIVWMSRNLDTIPRIKHGLVLSCLGDDGGFTYKRSRRGDADIDRAVQYVLAHEECDYQVIDFSPYGYDERNFCSPRFNLPVGAFTRSTHSSYEGYHTSGDSLDLVKPGRLAESLNISLRVLEVLEGDQRYLSLTPEAEPQLGKRGLYGNQGGLLKRPDLELALLWVMNLSDGDNSLIDIANRSGYPFQLVLEAAESLLANGLLRIAAPGEKL